MRKHPVLHYRITPCLPYSLVRTGIRLSTFREVVDRFDGESFQRLVFLGRKGLVIEVIQQGQPSQAHLRVKLTWLSSHQPNWEMSQRVAAGVLERVLGIGSDVRPFYKAHRHDPLLGLLIHRFYGLRVAGRRNVWESLLQVILSQQIHLKIAHRMLNDLVQAYGRRARLDGTVLFDFPSPRRFLRIGEAELRGFGMSGAKAATLLRVSEAFVSGELSEDMLWEANDDTVIEKLISIKGIGRWTAEFVLLRGLSRLDVFPASDLGVVKYVAQDLLGYKSPASEADMRAYAERFRPYRGLALIYAYAEIARQKRQASS